MVSEHSAKCTPGKRTPAPAKHGRPLPCGATPNHSWHNLCCQLLAHAAWCVAPLASALWKTRSTSMTPLVPASTAAAMSASPGTELCRVLPARPARPRAWSVRWARTRRAQPACPATIRRQQGRQRACRAGPAVSCGSRDRLHAPTALRAGMQRQGPLYASTARPARSETLGWGRDGCATGSILRQACKKTARSASSASILRPYRRRPTQLVRRATQARSRQRERRFAQTAAQALLASKKQAPAQSAVLASIRPLPERRRGSSSKILCRWSISLPTVRQYARFARQAFTPTVSALPCVMAAFQASTRTQVLALARTVHLARLPLGQARKTTLFVMIASAEAGLPQPMPSARCALQASRATSRLQSPNFRVKYARGGSIPEQGSPRPVPNVPLASIHRSARQRVQIAAPAPSPLPRGSGLANALPRSMSLSVPRRNARLSVRLAPQATFLLKAALSANNVHPGLFQRNQKAASVSSARKAIFRRTPSQRFASSVLSTHTATRRDCQAVTLAHNICTRGRRALRLKTVEQPRLRFRRMILIGGQSWKRVSFLDMSASDTVLLRLCIEKPDQCCCVCASKNLICGQPQRLR